MTDRLPVHAIDPAGATDGQVPKYDAATGVVTWADGATTGGVESVVAGTGVTVDDTDPANPIVSATGSTDPEVVRDTIAAALVAGPNVTITPDDAGDTITISATGGGGGGGSTRSVDDPTDASWGAAATEDVECDTDGTALPSGWSWVNQGTSTWQQKFGWGILTPQSGAAATSDDAHRLIVHAYPAAATWELTGKLSGPFPNEAGWVRSALVLRDSTTGKYIAYGFATYASFYGIHMNYWNSPGVFGGTEPISNTAFKTQDAYFRIRRTGASAYDFEISPNGVVWARFLTGHNPSGFLTPNQIGILSRRPGGSVFATGVQWLRVR